ncbi:uncharacterized protein LY89DRAFT_736910 [Mollisia scopiformis]|uniref:Zn(2)-C6 fungal-type domain-containing protein n=1 Tax=Mollisia scopiformis TaxID=149040 RepID=A0A194X140_MOLSC|nr:uncharacterized protein LY89DRAFT_736910 [Mollisia scopiformis]KUJ13911.1 hypothetical protein LY89DRAFT_736910 [Mollisia scopiformis]
MRQFPVKGLGKEEKSQSLHDDISSSSPATDGYVDGHFDTVDVCTTQLWFPAQLNSWNGFLDWSHDGSMLVNETWPYQDASDTGTADVWTPGFTDCRTDSSVSLDSQSFDHISSHGLSNHGRTEYPGPPQIQSPSMGNQHMYLPPSNLPILEKSRYPSNSPYNADNLHRPQDSDWMGFSPRTAASVTSHPTSDVKPRLTLSTTLPANVPLQWSMSNQNTPVTPGLNKESAAPIPKRKHVSPGPPPAKKSRQVTSQTELAEYVGVFENAPGALTTVKKRKKLDGAVRKAAQDVRKAGACHQCRFRKRTCSIGTPCTSCLKNGRGLHDLKCQRESPFIGKSIHPYFEHSSTKRVLSFDILVPLLPIQSSGACYVTIDGIEKISHTIKLRAYAKSLDSFGAADRAAIRKTEIPNNQITDTDGESPEILILEDHEALGTQVEQWAVEYASKFVHAAGPKFYPTTAAVILGTAYLKKGLPESELVAAMLRAASIAFVLRAGVKYKASGNQSTSQYRTIEASIDTILYQRLKLAEKDLYKMLQRIVFRSLGYIAREHIYPVALVFWQLLRMLCLSSSHLSNIYSRFKTIPSEHASFQFNALKLVLSTHFALFRSSNPLLLDFNDKPNQDLLAGDEELIDLAMKMRKVVLDFREKGVRDMKGSIAYRKEHFDLFRKVYDGL